MSGTIGLKRTLLTYQRAGTDFPRSSLRPGERPIVARGMTLGHSATLQRATAEDLSPSGRSTLQSLSANIVGDYKAFGA
jgi:hypothetical protein